MARTRQQQTVSIDRGLFLVRYAAAEDTEHPPIVRVSPDPSSNKDIGFLLHPDHSEPVLWQPDTSLVVRALAAGKLAVEVVSAQEEGSTAATVRIEPLTQGKPITAVSQTVPERTNSTADRNTFRILGHVTGLGDQFVNANEWLAGPSAPSRIEGIAIDWPDKPGDLEIRYAVKTAKPEPISGRAMGLGSFAGTRGKAMPIVAVMLEMSGPAATGLQFAVETIFLGSPAKRITGKRVIATGPTSREPLVGLRLSLEDAVAERPLTKSSSTKVEESAGDAPRSGNGPEPAPSDQSSSATKIDGSGDRARASSKRSKAASSVRLSAATKNEEFSGPSKRPKVAPSAKSFAATTIEGSTDNPPEPSKRPKAPPSVKSSAATKIEGTLDATRVSSKQPKTAPSVMSSTLSKLDGSAGATRVFRKQPNLASSAKSSSASKIERAASGVRVFRSRSKPAQPVTA